MKCYLKIFLFCFVFAAALPVCAQNKKTGTAQNKLSQAVDRAVATAQQQPPCDCFCQRPLDPREVIDAEEELQLIRSTRDYNATFEKYPYLLDPNYRRKDCACTCQKQGACQKAEQPGVLSARERLDAEEELALIRNTQDSNATFDKYPYLLSPAYRRASEDGKRMIRRQYTQPTWAKKVGI